MPMYADVLVALCYSCYHLSTFEPKGGSAFTFIAIAPEAYDRGGKFRLYRKNPVLQDYLLISSARIEIDLYHKNDAGEWVITNYTKGDMVDLKSVDLQFPIEQVYRNLKLTPDVK